MILNNNNQKIELEEVNINEDVKQVLLGSLLGDGSLTINKNGKNAFYRELHGSKQKEYILWKNSFLKIFDTKIYEYSTFDNRTNKNYYSILLWSKVNRLLTKFYYILYKEGKKTINKEFLNQLNTLGLAIWYMDDGYYHYGDYRCAFGTDSYSYVDHVVIRDWLKEKFGIKAQIHGRSKNNINRYTIVLSKKETDKFLRSIEPHSPQFMHYKLGHLKEGNYLKIKKHDAKRIEYRKLDYQKNKEKYFKHNREYYNANRDRLLRYREKYYLNNKEKILKQKKDYHQKNRDMLIKKMRLRYRQNIEERRKKGREYYYKNHEKILGVETIGIRTKKH